VHFYYEHDSQSRGEATSITIKKSKTALVQAPWNDLGDAFLCVVKYITHSEGRMLVSAHASTGYALW